MGASREAEAGRRSLKRGGDRVVNQIIIFIFLFYFIKRGKNKKRERKKGGIWLNQIF